MTLMMVGLCGIEEEELIQIVGTGIICGEDVTIVMKMTADDGEVTHGDVETTGTMIVADWQCLLNKGAF